MHIMAIDNPLGSHRIFLNFDIEVKTIDDTKGERKEKVLPIKPRIFEFEDWNAHSKACYAFVPNH